MEMERGGWGGGETERGRCSIGGVSEEMQRLLLQLPRHHDADVSGEGMSSLVKVSPEDIVAGSRVPEEVGVEGMKLGDEEKGKVRGGEEEEEDEGEGMEVKFGEAFSPRGQEALPFIQEQALNKDGLKQYSLTPHPRQLPEGVVEDIIRARQAVQQRNLHARERIIRFVTLQVEDKDGSPSSQTTGKSIIRPPSADYLRLPFTDPKKRVAWQINLSPEDSIRATPFPAEGNLTVTLKQHTLTGDYDSLNFSNMSTSLPYYLIPLVLEETMQPHELFTHVKMVVDSSDNSHVSRIYLMYIPNREHAATDESAAAGFTAFESPWGGSGSDEEGESDEDALRSLLSADADGTTLQRKRSIEVLHRDTGRSRQDETDSRGRQTSEDTRGDNDIGLAATKRKRIAKSRTREDPSDEQLTEPQERLNDTEEGKRS